MDTIETDPSEAVPPPAAGYAALRADLDRRLSEARAVLELAYRHNDYNAAKIIGPMVAALVREGADLERTKEAPHIADVSDECPPRASAKEKP